MRTYSATLFVASLLTSATVAHAGGVSLVDPNAAPKQRQRGVSLAGGQERVAPVTRERRPGEVLINVEDADLTTVVLPLIQRQAGVSIRYAGAPRRVSLRLVQPVPWEDAVALVCQFTTTHLTTDGNGRFLLKPRFGGELSEKDFDTLDGQIHTPERILALRASARRRVEKLPPPPTLPTIRIGNPRPMRFGPANPRQPRTGASRPQGRAQRPWGVAQRQGPRRVGPTRVGPGRTGPARTGAARPFVASRVGPRRTGPAKTGSARVGATRQGPRRTGGSRGAQPRRPNPGF